MITRKMKISFDSLLPLNCWRVRVSSQAALCVLEGRLGAQEADFRSPGP